MRPDPDAARQVLEAALVDWNKPDVHKVDLMVALAEALGCLKGYRIPEERWQAYRCSHCGAHGVKLWRAAHSDREAWCARCGCAQAGRPDEADDEGRVPSKYSGRVDGRSDQIYSAAQGSCLLPYVPCLDGGTWGYCSVPPEGVRWWRRLPTRKEVARDGG